MNIVKGKVYLMASTVINLNGINSYLEDINAQKRYQEDSMDTLSEIAGRLCYKSWEVGLNKNVTKVREGNKEYIGNILESGHGSVLEHSNVSLLFADVSRVFTHELVRHRAGMAYSQESLRYVRLEDIKFYLPIEIKNDPKLKELYEKTVKHLEEVQKELNEQVALEDTNFEYKKKWTSRFRRLAPLGLCTNILATGNLRAWRHIIAMRSSSGAEEEMIEIMRQVRSILNSIAPNVFQDMTN